MSDNDQISRSELLDRISVLESEAQVAIIECAARNSVAEGRWIVVKMELEIVRRIVEDAPPVEPPMSAVEYVDALERMFVEDHQVYDEWYDVMLADDGDVRENRHKAVSIVEAWAREHPERSEKK